MVNLKVKSQWNGFSIYIQLSWVTMSHYNRFLWNRFLPTSVCFSKLIDSPSLRLVGLDSSWHRQRSLASRCCILSLLGFHKSQYLNGRRMQVECQSEQRLKNALASLIDSFSPDFTHALRQPYISRKHARRVINDATPKNHRLKKLTPRNGRIFVWRHTGAA